MLHAQWHAETGTPVVFLHGLLGSGEDWLPVLTLLQNSDEIRPLTLDLPYHGKSENIACPDFARFRELLHQTLQQQIGGRPFYLVGYSLGGRLALDYTLNIRNPYLKHTFLESANIGLSDPQERAMRRSNDMRWAERFRHEPIEEVLKDWYRQPVFADLDDDKRSDLLKKRQNNNGAAIACMLEATGLAEQPDFAPLLSTRVQKALTFFIGEHDAKFRRMAEQHHLPHQLISTAGHNAHRENPWEFAAKLLAEIRR